MYLQTSRTGLQRVALVRVQAHHVLWRSFLCVQVSTSAKATELNSELQAARQRLSVYEGLERELDETVMRAGASALASPDSVLSPPALRVPSSAEARLKQSIMLSTELIAARRVADELR